MMIFWKDREVVADRVSAALAPRGRFIVWSGFDSSLLLQNTFIQIRTFHQNVQNYFTFIAPFNQPSSNCC